jgi:1-acyl-sn-glycerol-3-phosphate acyltransferase
MIYSILKVLIKITLAVFFNKKVVHAKNNIPKEGPLIIVANHPGTFLDPLIIAATLNRQVHFLAKGSMFKGKLVNWVFKQFNMIPVYRAQDDSSKMGQNTQTFEKCFEHLENNGVILIFPEGVSITEKKLKPIKTGAARIALGAEKRNEFKLGVKILPIGLNYENPHQFRKDVFVNFGEPIDASAYQDSFQQQEVLASKEFTLQIKNSLSNLIIDIDDKKQEMLSNAIYNLHKSQMSLEDPTLSSDKLEDFNYQKNIAEAVAYFAKYQKARFNAIYYRVRNYSQAIEFLKIDDRVLEEKTSQKPLVTRITLLALKLVIGLPIFLYGFIHNYLPFAVSPILTKKINNELEYRGPISMVIGMFLYLMLYTVYTICMFCMTENWIITILYLISLPLTGMLAYWYSQNITSISNKWKYVSLFYKKNSTISKLVLERKALIKEIEKGREEYLEVNF